MLLFVKPKKVTRGYFLFCGIITNIKPTISFYMSANIQRGRYTQNGQRSKFLMLYYGFFLFEYLLKGFKRNKVFD